MEKRIVTKVTITYSDGRVETKTMSRAEAMELQMQKTKGQLPIDIQAITVDYPSNPA